MPIASAMSKCIIEMNGVMHMNNLELQILNDFKRFLLKRVRVSKVILFGSRARGDSGAFSDMDVVVILDNASDDHDIDYVSDCAWEAGFEHGIVIVPVVFTQDEWENGPERYSLLAQAVEAEGVPV
jgi:glutathionylspermidine synthase